MKKLLISSKDVTVSFIPNEKIDKQRGFVGVFAFFFGTFIEVWFDRKEVVANRAGDS